MKGIVKWFNLEKGFGFITGQDEIVYFVHFSDIESDGLKYLEEGESVEFDIADEARSGQKAVKVKRTSNIRIELKDGNSESLSVEKMIDFLKFERENLLRIIGENHSEFNKGRMYAMDKMIDGMEVIFKNV